MQNRSSSIGISAVALLAALSSCPAFTQEPQESNSKTMTIETGGTSKQSNISQRIAISKDDPYPPADVEMSCIASDDGRSIRIDVNNPQELSMKCRSVCFFVTKNGDRGMLNCRGTVSRNYKGVFCHDTPGAVLIQHVTPLRVVDPGIVDCVTADSK